MRKFSKTWVKSTSPRKQRKYRSAAPLHLRRKMMAGHLSAELRKKYDTRAFPIRKGDKVKVVRGEFKGTIGKIEEIDVRAYKVFVAGVEREKGEGQPASKYPLDASNLKVIELELSDKKRKAALERAGKHKKKVGKEENK